MISNMQTVYQEWAPLNCIKLNWIGFADASAQILISSLVTLNWDLKMPDCLYKLLSH